MFRRCRQHVVDSGDGGHGNVPLAIFRVERGPRLTELV